MGPTVERLPRDDGRNTRQRDGYVEDVEHSSLYVPSCGQSKMIWPAAGFIPTTAPQTASKNNDGSGSDSWPKSTPLQKQSQNLGEVFLHRSGEGYVLNVNAMDQLRHYCFEKAWP